MRESDIPRRVGPEETGIQPKPINRRAQIRRAREIISKMNQAAEDITKHLGLPKEAKYDVLETIVGPAWSRKDEPEEDKPEQPKS